jgi:hypothetical protein
MSDFTPANIGTTTVDLDGKSLIHITHKDTGGAIQLGSINFDSVWMGALSFHGTSSTGDPTLGGYLNVPYMILESTLAWEIYTAARMPTAWRLAESNNNPLQMITYYTVASSTGQDTETIDWQTDLHYWATGNALNTTSAAGISIISTMLASSQADVILSYITTDIMLLSTAGNRMFTLNLTKGTSGTYSNDVHLIGVELRLAR